MIIAVNVSKNAICSACHCVAPTSIHLHIHISSLSQYNRQSPSGNYPSSHFGHTSPHRLLLLFVGLRLPLVKSSVSLTRWAVSLPGYTCEWAGKRWNWRARRANVRIQWNCIDMNMHRDSSWEIIFCCCL